MIERCFRMSPHLAADSQRDTGDGEKRQQMDRAPAPPKPDFMDEEAGDGDVEYGNCPYVSQYAMGAGSLRSGKLDHADHQGHLRNDGVGGNRRHRIEERPEIHV